MKKIQLVEEICDFYNVDLIIDNGHIVMTDQLKRKYEYKSIDEMLNDWLFTLLESNEDAEYLGKFQVWKESELMLIPNYLKEVRK